uniref:Calmodulin-lysine N-methyltransferase n=1 Tax=Minutocellus polymorphus TaxID=265543 RepID=A0A7S0AUK0_9STRA
MGTDGDTAFATVGDKPVYFDEDWDTGIGGGLWSTGAAMAKYFEGHAQSIRSSLKSGKNGPISAIELGSGNGYLSVCLAAIADDLLSELVVTDLADHLSLMTKTLERNSHLVDVVTAEEFLQEGTTKDLRPTAIVAEHKWGVTEEEESSAVCGKKFDFIFGSDVAYRDWLHAPLIASLDRLSHENTLSLIGVTMQDTKPSFFKSLSDAGFRYERLPDHLMEPEFRGTTFGLFVIQRSKLPPRKINE